MQPCIWLFLWQGIFWNALKSSGSKRQADAESCCWQSYILGSNPSDMTVCMQPSSILSCLGLGLGLGWGWGQGHSLGSLRNFFPCNCSSSTCTWGQNQAGPRQGLPLPGLTICSQMLVVKTWFFSSLKKKTERKGWHKYGLRASQKELWYNDLCTNLTLGDQCYTWILECAMHFQIYASSISPESSFSLHLKKSTFITEHLQRTAKYKEEN